jgi:class 3 adenylate cyclase
MTECGSCGVPLPAGARFCPACGAPVDHGTAAVDERKLATVLFADLVGSTARADKEDPERVRLRLERFYEAMTDEIERTGGTVEKFAGDSVMAAFGAPAALEDHAERALHAALGMQRRLGSLFGDDLQLRIGVNTGEVVVGQPREGTSFVTGDAVNVGARLEQAAAAGEVLAGERTVAAAGGAFDFGERRVVEAKGKPGGVVGRPVLRALTLMRPRGVGGLRRVFVGRDSEIELLRSTYRRVVAHGEPHLMTVIGEPGVGKTRLIRELWEILAEEEPTPLRRTGRCLAYGDGITYWPVGEVLKEHLGLRDGDSPEEVIRKLDAHAILGLALGLDVAGELHPRDARERLHEAVVAFVEELASERPVVLLVEDLHWAESDLLDLIERIVADARVPVLMLATARPELLDHRPAWGAGRRNATAIWLDPLSAEDTARLLVEMLPVELSAELRGLVVDRADGNPFFLEELVGDLGDAGVLERTDTGWMLGEPREEFTMPDTVHAVLAARMDRLPTIEKAALQAAAVVGRVFWTTPVIELLDGELPDFDLLEERDLIRSSRGSTIAGEREYAIKHALTREVAYASIPKARRGRLHATFAAWLERSDLGRDEYAALLAYHYSEAVRPEDADLVWANDAVELERLRSRATHWLRRAGELARGRYEIEKAVELFTRGAELADEPRQEAELWCEVGLANALRYDGEGFWKAMLRGLDLHALDTGAEAEAYSLLAFQTAIRSGMWLEKPDLAPLPGWIERALDLAAPDSRARTQALLARSHTTVSETDAVAASALADKLGDAELRSYGLGARASSAAVQGRWEDASTLSENRLQLVAGIDDLDHHCEAYESAVPIAVAVGRFGEARRLAALHAEAAARLSPHHRLHAVALRLEIAENVADWHDALSNTEAVIAAVEGNAGTPCVRNARTLIACGLAHVATGDEATADDLLARAAGLEGEGWSSYFDPLLLRFALVRGDRAEAERLVERVFEREFVFGPSVRTVRLDALAALGLRDAVELEAPASLRPRTFIEPFALRALGIVRHDDELLASADERFRALGLEWHAAQTGRLVAGL